jgi:hypothetical protein
MTQPQTYSPAHIRRQREAHTKADGYGRHRHLYLHDTIRRLAARLKQERPEGGLTWLDYGCGKGSFIEQILPMGLFSKVAGYDPAVEAFHARPEGHYDLVTCLDVLDKVEPRFLDAVLADVAVNTSGLAIFDHLTLPKHGSGLTPHPPFYWTHLVRRHMDVMDTTVEFPGMQDFERAVIVAAPRSPG